MKITNSLDPAVVARDVVLALHNGLTPADNFAPDGTKGYLLVSRGTDGPPGWASSADALTTGFLHALADGSGLGPLHTVSGLTVGQVLRATGATSAAFAFLQASDLPTHTHPFTDITGVAARAQLPAAIAYEDEANTFTPAQTFSGLVTVNPGPLVVGADPGGPEALRVGGEARITGAIHQHRGTTRSRFGEVGADDNWQWRSNRQADATKPSWAIVNHEGPADNFAIYRAAPGGIFARFLALSSASNLHLDSGVLIFGAGASQILGNNGIGTTPNRIRFNQGSPVAIEAVNADETDYAPFRASQLYLTNAASRIIPGATSLSLRNSADTADNLLLTDAGLATFRNTVTTTQFNATTAGSAYAIGGSVVLWKDNWLRLTFPGGGTISVAGTVDPSTYSDATSHLWRNLAGTSNFANLNSTLFDLGAGGSGVDLRIGSLGRFDSTDTPTEGQILIYKTGSINKWQAESLNAIWGDTDFKAAILADGAATYIFFDPGTGADSPVGAPPTPGALTVTQQHGTHTVELRDYAKPADFRWFEFEYSKNGVDWFLLANATSLKVVHSRLPFDGTTFRYRVRVEDRAGNHSADSTVAGPFTPERTGETHAFGAILAGEIAVANLAAITATMGILTSGQIRGPGNIHGINFSGAGGIPGTWVSGINFENTTVTGMTRYLNFNATAHNNLFKTERLTIGHDGTFLLYQTSTQPMLKLDGTDFLLQNDAASPVHGILLDGTRPASWKRYLDLVDGVLTIKDDQGSPVTRVQAGKVGAGATDYGLQVFDSAAATIMDFTGAKRILAVPVQPSVDSGTTLTVDLSTGLTQQVRLTGTATLTLNNPINGARYRFWLQQDTVGSRPFPTIKGPTGDEIVMFTNDTAPVLTTTPGVFDVFELEYRTSPTKRFTCMPLQTNVLLPTPKFESSLNHIAAATGTTHDLTVTGAAAGRLLLVAFGYRVASGSGSLSVSSVTAGWTIVADNAPTGGLAGLAVIAKVSDGSETTLTVTTSASSNASATMYSISRWFGSLSGLEVSAFATGISANPDSSSLNPTWAVDRDLWFSVATQLGASGITTVPSNYGNQVLAQNTNSPSLTTVSARRILYATAENPGAWTLSASASWVAITIAARPLA